MHQCQPFHCSDIIMTSSPFIPLTSSSSESSLAACFLSTPLEVGYAESLVPSPPSLSPSVSWGGEVEECGGDGEDLR